MSEKTYTLTEATLQSLIQKTSEAVATRMLVDLGLKKSQITQREAFRRFGKTRIMRWKSQGKTTPKKIGNSVYYPLAKLERLSEENDLL